MNIGISVRGGATSKQYRANNLVGVSRVIRIPGTLTGRDPNSIMNACFSSNDGEFDIRISLLNLSKKNCMSANTPKSNKIQYI